MKERKRIALLVGQPEEDNQALFIKGFLEQSFLYDYDVCIFAMYQKYQETQNREVGEAHIFSLIEYHLFDAVVVLAIKELFFRSCNLCGSGEQVFSNRYDGSLYAHETSDIAFDRGTWLSGYCIYYG